MQIADILTPERVAYSASISSKKTALEELSRLMAGNNSSLSPTGIFDCLNARERLGSTGLGNGIAIPHGRYDQVQRPVAALLRLEQGLNYDAIDHKPVDLLFSLLVPAESSDEHLRILAMLAEKLSNPELLNQLRNSASPQELYDLITRG